MSKSVALDSNVLVVANRQNNQVQDHCVMSAREQVALAMQKFRICLDTDDAVLTEYSGKIDAEARPQDIAARLLIWLRQSRFSDKRIRLLDLEKGADGEYTDCPTALIEAGFDPSDRKFVALARKADAVVVNTTDSDWFQHAKLLKAEGVVVENVCGCKHAGIFKP